MAEPIIPDERWMGEFVKLGLRECDDYLDKYARFDAYYAGREGTTHETTLGGESDGSTEAGR